MHAANFFVITGGPGSGKSALVRAIREHGWASISESGREIIRERKARGESPRPCARRFGKLMLARDIRKYTSARAHPGPVIFDRGIADGLGYANLLGLDSTAVCAAVDRYRYNETVFIAPPWPEIYINDEDRDQTFEEAVLTYEAVVAGYASAGYRLVELPKVGVGSRLEFLLKEVGRH